MAKKKNKDSINNNLKKGNLKKNSSSVVWIIIAVGIILGGLYIYNQGHLNHKTKSFQVVGGETRPILSPAKYEGKTRMAYTAAKENPKILDQLYCYCSCDEPPFHHKSLLSCFTDDHGEL